MERFPTAGISVLRCRARIADGVVGSAARASSRTDPGGVVRHHAVRGADGAPELDGNRQGCARASGRRRCSGAGRRRVDSGDHVVYSAAQPSQQRGCDGLPHASRRVLGAGGERRVFPHAVFQSDLAAASGRVPGAAHLRSIGRRPLRESGAVARVGRQRYGSFGHCGGVRRERAIPSDGGAILRNAAQRHPASVGRQERLFAGLVAGEHVLLRPQICHQPRSPGYDRGVPIARAGVVSPRRRLICSPHPC